MKTLLLMRHAKSSWDNPDLKDHDRPLNKRGNKAAPLMARWAQSKNCLPESIVTSTACRALRTAELFVENCSLDIELVTDRRLYHAAPEDMAEVARETDNDIGSLMLVGHNPGMQAIVTALTGQWESMPTAALAKISIPIDSWFDFRVASNCQLEAIWRPKELPEMFG